MTNGNTKEYPRYICTVLRVFSVVTLRALYGNNNISNAIVNACNDTDTSTIRYDIFYRYIDFVRWRTTSYDAKYYATRIREDAYECLKDFVDTHKFRRIRDVVDYLTAITLYKRCKESKEFRNRYQNLCEFMISGW